MKRGAALQQIVFANSQREMRRPMPKGAVRLAYLRLRWRQLHPTHETAMVWSGAQMGYLWRGGIRDLA